MATQKRKSADNKTKSADNNGNAKKKCPDDNGNGRMKQGDAQTRSGVTGNSRRKKQGGAKRTGWCPLKIFRC